MRVGIFKDRHGANYDITKNVLEKIVQTFNPSKPPHLLVGHPDAHKAPSFGIVKALKVVGDKLLFQPGKFCVEFAALVRRGGFPGVSAGLTHDLSRLDHVAFLSAQKPAISGLEPIAEFSAPADGGESLAIEITETADNLAEFGSPAEDWLTRRIHNIAEILRNVKNYLIERTSAEDADRMIPEWQLEALNDDPPVDESQDAQFAASAASTSSATETTTPLSEPVEGNAENYQAKYNELLPLYKSAKNSLSEFTAAMQKIIDDKTALSNRVAELEKEVRLAEFSAWVEERIAEGKVTPDEKQALVDRMENAHVLTGAEFSGDSVNHPKALDILKKDIMSRSRRTPPLGEMAAPEFSSCPTAVGSPVNIGNRARAYMDEQKSKGVTVTEWDAVNYVMNFKL
jgi:hypothetical protein